MQEYSGDKLVNTKLLEMLEKDGVKKVTEAPKLNIPPMAKSSTHQVIGKLPKKEQEITLNGLIYIVTFVDSLKGLFHAKIKRPN